MKQNKIPQYLKDNPYHPDWVAFNAENPCIGKSVGAAAAEGEGSGGEGNGEGAGEGDAGAGAGTTGKRPLGDLNFGGDDDGAPTGEGKTDPDGGEGTGEGAGDGENNPDADVKHDPKKETVVKFNDKDVVVPNQFVDKEGNVNLEALLKSNTDLRSKVGTPPPKSLEFNFPEIDGMEFSTDDPGLQSAKEVAQKHGLSQEAFDELLGMHIASVVNTPEELNKMEEQKLVAALGDDWKDVAQAEMNKIAAVLKPEPESDLYNSLMEVASTADGVQALMALGNAIGGEQAPSNKTASPPTQYSREELQKMIGSDKYANDPAYRKMVDDAYEASFKD